MVRYFSNSRQIAAKHLTMLIAFTGESHYRKTWLESECLLLEGPNKVQNCWHIYLHAIWFLPGLWWMVNALDLLQHWDHTRLTNLNSTLQSGISSPVPWKNCLAWRHFNNVTNLCCKYIFSSEFYPLLNAVSALSSSVPFYGRTEAWLVNIQGHLCGGHKFVTVCLPPIITKIGFLTLTWTEARYCEC